MVLLISLINAGTSGYLVGVILALAILAYLTYSLIKPEKF